MLQDLEKKRKTEIDYINVVAYTIDLVVPAEHPDIAFVQRRTISG